VTKLQTGWSRAQIQTGPRDFSLLQKIQTSYGYLRLFPWWLNGQGMTMTSHLVCLFQSHGQGWGNHNNRLWNSFALLPSDQLLYCKIWHFHSSDHKDFTSQLYCLENSLHLHSHLIHQLHQQGLKHKSKTHPPNAFKATVPTNNVSHYTQEEF
jgi:hypothetical protein